MNKAASALGRLGKGIPKNYTPAERRRRARRCKGLVNLRWAKKLQKTVDETLPKLEPHYRSLSQRVSATGSKS